MTERLEIHQSGLNMLFKCGEQYRRHYIEKEIRAPQRALCEGRAVHKAAEHSLIEKFLKHELPPLDTVLDLARDTVKAELSNGITLTDEEAARPVSELKAESVDKSVSLARLHYTELLPNLNPSIMPEKKFLIELGPEVAIGGMIDLLDGDTVADLKTAKKSPVKGAASESMQLTLYAMAKAISANELKPETVIPVRLDHLVYNETPIVVSLSDTRGWQDFQRLMNRITVAAASIKAGIFLPANPMSWWCGKDWCGFYEDCIYRAK